MSKKILIIDGDSIMHTAYNGAKKTPSYSEDGIPNYLIRQFIYSYSKMIKDLGVTDTVFVFDSKEKTFRHKLAEDYKSNRSPKELEMAIQESILYSLIDKSGFKKLIVDGYEADDVVASIAIKAIDNGYDKAYIATKDKDLYQVLQYSEKISIWNIHNKKEINCNNILDFFPVKEDKVVSYLCLVGDGADYVSGVKGVGGVSAVKLIDYFGNFVAIFDNIDEIHHKEIGIGKKAWDELVKIKNEDDSIIDHNINMISLVLDIDVGDIFETVFCEESFDVISEQLDELGLNIGFKRFYGLH